MFIPYTKAQRINESSCMFVAGRDGRTADAEHWRQQWRHIYVVFVYVPPHAPCPWFGMSAMFRAMAAEVRWVLISTLIFQGCWGPKFVSQALSICRKKTSELEKLRTFRTLFLTNGQSKLRSWVLLSSVRVTKKISSSRSKNIRPKTSDLRPSYLFYIDTYRTPLLM